MGVASGGASGWWRCPIELMSPEVSGWGSSAVEVLETGLRFNALLALEGSG